MYSSLANPERVQECGLLLAVAILYCTAAQLKQEKVLLNTCGHFKNVCLGISKILSSAHRTSSAFGLFKSTFFFKVLFFFFSFFWVPPPLPPPHLQFTIHDKNVTILFRFFISSCQGKLFCLYFSSLYPYLTHTLR